MEMERKIVYKAEYKIWDFQSGERSQNRAMSMGSIQSVFKG